MPNTQVCASCGCTSYLYKFQISGVVTHLCSRCLIKKVFVCQHCKQLKTTEPIILDTLEVICSDCNTQLKACGNCGKKTTNLQAKYGLELCRVCDKHLKKCASTGVLVDLFTNKEEAAFYVNNHKAWNRVYKTYGFVLSHHIESFAASVGITKQERFLCIHCSNPSYNYFTVDGRPLKVCEDCQESYRVCDSCGGFKCSPYSINTEELGDQCVCVECYTTKYYRCAGCNRFGKGSPVLKGQYKLCKTCSKALRICAVCEKLTLSSKQINVVVPAMDFDETITTCDKCSSRLGPCDVCGNFTTHKRILSGKCLSCYGPSTILGYSTRQSPLFAKDSKELYFGIENEVEVKEGLEDAASVVHSVCSDTLLICKNDSSINHGFEIVTCPMPFNKITSVIDWTFLEKSKLFKPHKSCGMHIHLSKSAFTTCQLYKFIKFFHTYPKFITKMVGRARNSYNSLLNLEYQSLQNLAKIKKNNFSRHAMLNVTSTTVEVRAFASATNSTTVYKNVEFLKALFEFVNTISMKEARQVTLFKQYVENHKALYPNLHNFITSTQPR